MSTKKVCDYCGETLESSEVLAEIPPRSDTYTVSIFNTTTDKDRLEKDACASCVDLIYRLLNKSLDRLKKAMAAASDN